MKAWQIVASFGMAGLMWWFIIAALMEVTKWI